MADTTVAAPETAPASAGAPPPSDPLDAASTALEEGLAALIRESTPSEETAETPPAETEPKEGADAQTETPPEDQTGAAEGETEESQDPKEPTEEPPLKAKEQAVLSKLRETDPELHRDVRRMLQAVPDRAAEIAYQRLLKTQAANEIKGTPMAQDAEALTPEQRAAWIETLPEYKQAVDNAQGAVAADLAVLLGADVEALKASASDPDKLVGVFLSGSRVKSAIDNARKEAREAGLREGKALARSGGALPPSGDASRVSIAAPSTPEESEQAFIAGLQALAA